MNELLLIICCLTAFSILIYLSNLLKEIKNLSKQIEKQEKEKRIERALTNQITLQASIKHKKLNLLDTPEIVEWDHSEVYNEYTGELITGERK
jgi:CCR4-NOT transcriptional regulation complex NOT5 subunit